MGQAESRQEIESVLGLVDRELWIVTAAADGRAGGLVATWVSQASIDPQAPLVAAGIAPNHYTAQLIDASGRFGLHLLRIDQAELAVNFATGSGADRDKLAGIAWRSGPLGSPLLEDCLAWIECRVVARLDGGDRIYYWADVAQGARVSGGEPLRERGFLRQLSSAARQALQQNLQQDLRIQRPLRVAWRESMPDYLRPWNKGAQSD